jgi:hypothetical protein
MNQSHGSDISVEDPSCVSHEPAAATVESFRSCGGAGDPRRDRDIDCHAIEQAIPLES